MLITSFIVLDWTCWIIVSSLMSHVHNLKCEPICPLKCPTRAHWFVEHHSVSVPGSFASLISPNNQPNHQFPHFHAGYNHCWYWTLTLTVIQYVHLQGKKKHMNPSLTVLIHVAWPHVRYVPDLGPLTKVAQVWFEKIRHLHPHSSGKKNKKSDQCNVQSENQMCVTSTWSCKWRFSCTHVNIVLTSRDSVSFSSGKRSSDFVGLNTRNAMFIFIHCNFQTFMTFNRSSWKFLQIDNRGLDIKIQLLHPNVFYL